MSFMHRGSLVALGAVLALSACRKKPETVAEPVVPPPPAETCDAACQQRKADSVAAEQRRLAEEARLREERARAAAVEAARAALTATIYFDYDQFDVRGDARQALDAKLPILRANAGVQIRIAGHADERGSDQYNDALGQRRAAQAKQYLTDNGIDPSRITIVSYGESRPAVMGSDESAWSRNRRAEFEITAGGNGIVPPR